jgi:streptogramin lyase
MLSPSGRLFKEMIMTKKMKQPKHRLAIEFLEDRTLLSTWVPLDQVLMQGILKADALPPLSMMNLYAPDTTHTLTPSGQVPPGAVPVGVNGETGEVVLAVANNYVAQINVTGLSGAAAADPNQLLRRAQGELLQAELTYANDKALASVSITKYLGTGRFLMTAGTNDDVVGSPSLQNALGQLPGFQNVIPDYLFPSDELKATPDKPPPSLPPPTVPTLSNIGAPGGLVFSGSVSQTILPGTTISFSVNLDGGQTLAAIVTPGNNLQPTLTITDPKGKVIGSATGSAPGAVTALQAIPVGKSGTYQVVVGGVGSSGGNFTLQDLVNSQLQNERFLGGSNDNSLANAQKIDNSSLDLGNKITQSAVYGNIPLQPSAGDAFVSERGVGVQLVSSSGAIVATFNNPALSAGVINGMHIGPDGNLYVGVDTSPGNGTGGKIVELTQNGTLVTTITLPNDTPASGFYYPFGFAIASDGTFWVPQPNTGNVVHLGASGNLIMSYFIGSGTGPEWTAVRTDGQVFVSVTGKGTIQQLDPGTGKLTTFATDPGGLPFGLSFTSSGDLLVTDPNVGVERFNSSGNLTQVINDFNDAIDAEADPSGNILVGTVFNRVDKFTSGGALIHSTSIPGNAFGVAVVGTEGPPPAPADTTDYYEITLAKNQNATAVLSVLGGGGLADISLLSSDGTVQALGKVVNGSEETINSFIAPAKDTYFLRVTGNGVQYSLVLETGADFSNGANTTQASAQNLFPSSKGVDSVVGSLTPTSLWGVDWQPAPNQLIHAINTRTGAFTSTFSGPATPLTNPFGFNMAFDGTNLWFNDGFRSGSNTIFKLNPISGAVISQFAAPTATKLTGLAYLNGYLWGTDLSLNIYQIDPSSGKLVGQFSLKRGAVTGLAGDPSRGVLWAVSQSHTIFEIDPVTQTIIKTAPDGLNRNEQDLGFFNNELYVSETRGPGANDIAVFNADTLKETRDLPMNVATFISGLAADGFSLTPPNYYHISANAGDKLFITASTPYDPSQGPFQPANSLSPVLRLYDANGNLLASTTPGGTIDKFRIQTTGDYYVAISGDNGTTGDYTLSVYGASGPLPDFTVTGTNPPANSYNKPLKSITVDFNDSILLSSLPTANVTFGGLAATGFQVNNDHEVTWFLQATPPGLNIPYTFQIAAGTVQDIHGVGLTGFSETIIINTVPPHLITTSVEEGDIDSAGNLTYVTSFQEPIVPSSVSASSFDLHGNFRNADYGPTSFTLDATNTILTLKFSNLPQDNYTLTLFAPGFRDRAGYILDGEPHMPRPPSVPTGNGVEGGNFFVDFTLRHGTEALPVNFSPVKPIGDLIYQGSFTDVIANPPGATNTYTVNLAPNQTLTLDLTTDGNLQGSIVVYDPSNHLIASAAASSKGGEVLMQTVPITSGGTYSIVVGGANNTEGLFGMQVTLNAAATSGTHGTRGMAQDLSGSFLTLGGTSSRGAVVGGINQLQANTGDAYASERGGPGVVVVANAGGVASALSNPIFGSGVIGGMHEGPDGNLYIGLDTSPGNGTGGEIVKFSSTGTLLGTIPLPNDAPGVGFFYPFGFAIASDGTFWVPQPNTGNIVHLDASGNLIKSFSTGSNSNPEWAAVRTDGQVFISNDQNSTILQLDPGSGNLTTFATDPFGQPVGLTFTAAGNLLVSDFNVGVLVYDSSASILQTVSDFGALDAQTDPSGDFLIGNAAFNSVDKFDPNGNFQTFTNIPGTPIGLSVAGEDGPPPAAPVLDNFYSFHLDPGQSATIAYNQLQGTGTATVSLEDGVGNVLATATTGPTNFTQVISNFVSAGGGKYYIDVHGNNITYGLTITRNAAFDTEPNDSRVTAQPLPAAASALGAVFTPTGANVGTYLEGLNYFQNSCGCIPPDTNDAVGPTQVVEAINTEVQVYDKVTGTILLTQDIGSLLGIPAFSDPYIVYDDIANRFVMVELTTNSSGGDGVALAVSKDSNFLDGFQSVHIVDFGSNTLDFPKLGFNADAYVITGDLFGPSDTPLQVIAVDKQQLFNGNFVDYLYQRHPGFPNHFPAEVPAQMHGATAGMPMFLVEEAGFGNGSAARVVTLTNELSNNPTFSDQDIPVNPYNFPNAASQPGLPFSVATNDTTFSHAEWRMINGHGMLVSAQNVSEADDGFSTSRVRWYEFNTDGTPSLVQQGTINPGPGVSTYYGAPALDVNGDIGISYMESSSSEYVSFYVAGRVATDPLGTMSPGTDVAPGIQTGFNLFRAGDYGGISMDPTDGVTFWASNEYMGTNFVFNTALASFKVQRPQDFDYYSLVASPGQTLHATISLPGSSMGAQFANTLSPVIQLYNPSGILVASGTMSLSYTVPAGAGGTYTYLVTGATSMSQGEYFLQDPVTPAAAPVNTAAVPATLAETVDSRVSTVATDRGSGPSTRLAGPATTATPAGNGLAVAGGLLARPGSAEGGAAIFNFSTAPSPAGRAGETAGTNTGATTGFVPPGTRAWGTLPGGSADDAVTPAQPVTPLESADPVSSPQGRAANYEVLYRDEDTTSEERVRPVSGSGNGVPSDLPPHAFDGYLGSNSRMPSGSDSIPTSAADFGASSNPAAVCAAVVFVTLGGFHPAEAAEKFEEKRRRPTS